MKQVPPRLFAPATLSLGCLIYAALALVALHILRPDLTPRTNFISNYAVGKYGWVMTTWFVAMSGVFVSLALALSQGGLQGMAARIGKALFVVASIGLLVSAAFPTDLPGTPETRSGDLHELSFQINVASIIGGVILLTFAVTRDPSWRNFRAIALTFASLVLTGCFVQFATLQKGMPYGWANRFFVLTMMMWVGGFALRARQPGKGPAARGLV